MPISFACTQCGSRFDVDERLAGKQGRCRSCGAQMVVPQPVAVSTLAVSGLFRLSQDDSRQPAGAAATAGSERASLFPSSVGLAPLEEDDLDNGLDGPSKPKRKTSYDPRLLDETSPGSVYSLEESERAHPAARPLARSRTAGAATVAYRGGVGGLMALLRKLSDFAYLLSIPFFLVIIWGDLSQNRSLAVLGAVAVVLLNLGRLILNGTRLLGVPFKESPLTGILFLFPPFTIYYLATHWKKMRKAALRLIEPVLSIALVFAAFTFLPGLRGDAAPAGSLSDQVVGEGQALKSEMRDTIQSKKSSLGQAIDSVRPQARDVTPPAAPKP